MGSRRPFPSDVESFIAACFDSVEQVEILLLLSAERARSWTADEISEKLRSSHNSVNIRLTMLVAHGLVSRNGETFRYAANPYADALVQRLAETYSERRAAVIERIFSRHKDPMQSFADAFKLREDENPDG
jgi:predicted transcriptional regulator